MSTFAVLSHGSAATQVIHSMVELVQLPAPQVAKRIADVVISLIVLVALALPATIIALVIKAQSQQGPVLAKQLMAGKNGGFVKYSFHTDGNGFGSFLTITGLDIIPTFFNVLCGDVSLVDLVPAHNLTHTTLAADARIITKALTSAFTA